MKILYLILANIFLISNLHGLTMQDIQDIENYCKLQMMAICVEVHNSKPGDFNKFEAYAEGKLEAFSEIRSICNVIKKREDKIRLKK